MHSDLTLVVRLFIKHPSRYSFEESDYSSSISVKHLVNESLPLYPATRRIYRQMGLDDGASGERLGVDVETLQRQEQLGEQTTL
jgi:hypothetical protein